MSGKNEHALTRDFADWLVQMENDGRVGWWMKVGGGRFQRTGQADFLLCVNGRLLGIELKHPNGSGVVSAKQVIELTRMRRAGALTLVTSELMAAKRFVLHAIANQPSEAE